ncbi:uncharacterized protein BX664DRAFT_327411 [Halteromyces radiatus]|uniref:uncharacterized protein n=1 Tax=Halteromyces radiatus TaxID=101107 RepID=UPI00221F8294|nr:uncharacterized protein BX664DRAFT_327411 [Halteromyces radiatus]KAI8092494.1 hypothetical protein BX664DRAFT_327411 [Halteromyces radiatus]
MALVQSSHSSLNCRENSLSTSKTLRHWQSQPMLRSKASIQLSPLHAQAQTSHTTLLVDPPKALRKEIPRSPSSISHCAQQNEWHRTQDKLILQRQNFLADDKYHVDHPTNMKRLTKEMDRVNREYKTVRHFEDPMAESFFRVAYHHHSSSLPLSPWMQTSPRYISSSSSASSASSLSSGGLLDLSSTSPVLQRRASDFMLKRQDRRNSSTSIHSAILERSHHHHHHSSTSPAKGFFFFSRWFRPSLPPAKHRYAHHITG